MSGGSFSSGWKDISKIFIVATVLDAIYQFIELPAFHIIQLLIVAVGLAIVPYVLIRSPVTRLVRARHNNPARYYPPPVSRV